MGDDGQVAKRLGNWSQLTKLMNGGAPILIQKFLAPEVSALCCAASDLAISYLLTNKNLEIRPATPLNVINRRIKQFSISSS